MIRCVALCIKIELKDTASRLGSEDLESNNQEVPQIRRNGVRDENSVTLCVDGFPSTESRVQSPESRVKIKDVLRRLKRRHATLDASVSCVVLARHD